MYSKQYIFLFREDTSHKHIKIPILEYPNFGDKQKKTIHLTYEVFSGLLLQ